MKTTSTLYSILPKVFSLLLPLILTALIVLMADPVGTAAAFTGTPQLTATVAAPSTTPTPMVVSTPTAAPTQSTLSNSQQAPYVRTIDRNRFYISQARDFELNGIPSSFACGQTSVLMALADWGLATATEESRRELIFEVARERGQSQPGGLGGPVEIADLARKHGLNAEVFLHVTDLDKIDEQIRMGRSIVAVSEIHVVYIAGIDAQGQYIVGDPGTDRQTWSRAELQQFFTGFVPEVNWRGFTAVWR